MLIEELVMPTLRRRPGLRTCFSHTALLCDYSSRETGVRWLPWRKKQHRLMPTSL
jgi:hypothetical protein